MHKIKAINPKSAKLWCEMFTKPDVAELDIIKIIKNRCFRYIELGHPR